MGPMRERPGGHKGTAEALAKLLPVSKGECVPYDKWQRMSERERIECATGRTLDNCIDILDMPMEMAVRSPTVMSGKVQVIRAILTVVSKVGLESHRLRGLQEAALAQLVDDFAAEEERSGFVKSEK
jgi:hypothetical protein